jgi:hypothetical protein
VTPLAAGGSPISTITSSAPSTGIG